MLGHDEFPEKLFLDIFGIYVYRFSCRGIDGYHTLVRTLNIKAPACWLSLAYIFKTEGKGSLVLSKGDKICLFASLMFTKEQKQKNINYKF